MSLVRPLGTLAAAMLAASACTVDVLSDSELEELYGSLRVAVNPIGYAAEIDLDRVDDTVRITRDDQVDEFLAAASVPWTRILVADGVTLEVTSSLMPAVGVKIYCPDGSFTIDGRAHDNVNVILLQSPHIYMANFVLRVPVGDTTLGNNPYIGIDIARPTADLIYLQSFTIDAPGDEGNNSAAEALQIFNWAGPVGRITLDRFELVTDPSPGSKGVLVAGDDSSGVRITMARGIIRSHAFGVKARHGAFVDYFNNVSLTVERFAVVHVLDGGRVRARASYFHPRVAGTPGQDILIGDDSSAVSHGPEPNTAHPGVTLAASDLEAPLPPYPTPPVWDEETVRARAGAGTIVLPE